MKQMKQMKQMIKEVIRAGHKVGFFTGNRLNMNNTVRATQLYEAVQGLFEFKTSAGDRQITHTRRHSSLTWKTYHNNIQRNNWKSVRET